MRTAIALLLLSMVQVFGGANLIPNGSFELGMVPRGWIGYGSSAGDIYGNISAWGDRLVTTDAVHGAKSASWNTRMMHRPVYLTNGTYTLTFSIKNPSGHLIQFDLMKTEFLRQTPTARSVTPTANWTRVTNTFTIGTNWFYSTKFYHGGNSVPLIDAVKLEAGSVASAWTPHGIIEAGIDTPSTEATLWSTDSKVMRVQIWNDGPSTNFTWAYNIYDILNTNVGSGVVITNALAANTNTTITVPLPANRVGWLRVMGFITNLVDSWDEHTIAVLPFPVQSSVDTNGILGIAHTVSDYAQTTVRKIGFTHNNVKSPVYQVRWEQVQPNATTTNWPDFWVGVAATNIATRILEPYITLTPDDSSLGPSWAMGTRDTFITAYTNFVRGMVNRYKAAPYNIRRWEIFNEPQQTRSGPFQLSDGIGTNYAFIFTNAARVIKIEDPNAIVIGMGGMGDPNHAIDVWTNLTAQGQADMDIVSCHMYPGDLHQDPNEPEVDEQHVVNTLGWHQYWIATGLRPVWQTESATGTAGGMKGQNMWYAYPHYMGGGVWTPEGARADISLMQYRRSDTAIQNFVRCIGYGMSHHTIQLGKFPNDDGITYIPGGSGTQPYPHEYNSSLKPESVALVIAKWFMQNPGLGRITNVNNANVEQYLFTNATYGRVVVAWSRDRANRTVTTTNGNFAVYDITGNQLQTNATSFLLGRSTKYFVSGTLTESQMRNTFSNATTTIHVDDSGPNSSIDASPIGLIPSNSTQIIKWTSLDETKQVYTTASTGTNLLYFVKFASADSWISMGMSNHIFIAFDNPTKLYNVFAKAVDASGNEGPVVQGPTFWIDDAALLHLNDVPPPARFKRIKLKHVGMGSSSQPPPDSVVWISENGSTANNGSSPFSPVTYALAAGWTNIYLTSTQGCFGPPLGCFTNSTPVAFTNVPVAGYPLDFPYVFEIP